MKWVHKVNPEWLEARRNYLTASEICRLLPETPTGRARTRSKLKEEARAIWAEKQAVPAQEDIYSYGAMARGHLLEPFAIEDYNKAHVLQLEHWDDALIHNGRVAYSPDALSLRNITELIAVPTERLRPSRSGEVKSYKPSDHYAKASESPMNLMERWQIATGLYVSPSIELATLILYNPRCDHSMFVHDYTRSMLEKEIETIDEIAHFYYESIIGLDELYDTSAIPTCRTEDEIIRQLEEKETSKSIINPF